MSVGIRGAHHRIALVLTLLAACGLASRARAQDTTRAVTATLAKVLAMAADGYRTGQAVYFVVARPFPHNIVGAFGTPGEAGRAASAEGAGYDVFGPYLTPRDTTPAAFEIVGVTVAVRRDGEVERVEIDPNEVDALFLTRAAAERFLLPYYTAIYGSSWAERLRQMIAAGGGTCHKAPSYLCWTLRGLPTIPAFLPPR